MPLAEVAGIRRDLEASGHLILALRPVATVVGFFTAARADLPLDPPHSGRVHWDALTDSLFGGLYDCDSERIAVIVPDASRISADDPAAFADIRTMLFEVADLVEDQRRMHGRGATEVWVVIGV